MTGRTAVILVAAAGVVLLGGLLVLFGSGVVFTRAPVGDTVRVVVQARVLGRDLAQLSGDEWVGSGDEGYAAFQRLMEQRAFTPLPQQFAAIVPFRDPEGKRCFATVEQFTSQLQVYDAGQCLAGSGGTS